MSQITYAADLISKANYTVAFTGAGISTASGIPDFRGSTDSVWHAANPLDVASLRAFRETPKIFFDWVRPIVNTIICAKPNAGHIALATIQQLGLLRATITQNIDGLHQQAGNQPVLELHGHLRTATCTHCYRKFNGGDFLTRFMETGHTPVCECQARGSTIKPDIILFGEQLPHQIVTEARREIMQADLIIVAGSSLTVAPASLIPLQAIENGARLIIINYDTTPADEYADVVIHDDVNKILPQIASELKSRS